MSGANENEPVEGASTTLTDDPAAPDATAEPSDAEPPVDGSVADAEGDDDLDEEQADESYWNGPRARAALEAMLFAADEPLPLKAILESLPDAREETVRRALGQMMLELSGDARGIHLHEVAGGYQLRTNATYNEQVLLLFEAKPTKLSRAAMETLAIVAYRQPVTKAIVDEIRGVDCGGVLRGLTDVELIAVIGKADDIGRPNLYGTTQRFLEFFSLSALTDLPTLENFEVDALELLGEDVEHLLGERDSDEEEDERAKGEEEQRGEQPRRTSASDTAHRLDAPAERSNDDGDHDTEQSAPQQAQLRDFPHGTDRSKDDNG